METARVRAEIRMIASVAMLATGMALVTGTPVLAETVLSPSAAVVCASDQPESGEPWEAPPQRGRPGEPY